ncbi:hypothetical protein OC716_02515 [Candidatus Phytoplasma aurantifolia]|uniref:hypothetical protein n=1 Tax=Candidatus Phytoplasma citri TaxID=180978 RepID=UPI002713DFD8|nr:hypothetical protein [Candidatus Phytoplasma aurantifolia]
MLLHIDILQYWYILNLLLIISVIIFATINFFRKQKVLNKFYLTKKTIDKILIFIAQVPKEQKHKYYEWLLIISDNNLEIQKYLLRNNHNLLELLCKIIIFSNSYILYPCFNQLIWQMFVFLIFFIVPFIFEIINFISISNNRKRINNLYSIMKQISKEIENKQDL